MCSHAALHSLAIWCPGEILDIYIYIFEQQPSYDSCPPHPHYHFVRHTISDRIPTFALVIPVSHAWTNLLAGAILDVAKNILVQEHYVYCIIHSFMLCYPELSRQ